MKLQAGSVAVAALPFTFRYGENKYLCSALTPICVCGAQRNLRGAHGHIDIPSLLTLTW